MGQRQTLRQEEQYGKQPQHHQQVPPPRPSANLVDGNQSQNNRTTTTTFHDPRKATNQEIQQLWIQALSNQQLLDSDTNETVVANPSSSEQQQTQEQQPSHSLHPNDKLLSQLQESSDKNNNNTFFSSCLIVKDDNHWLIEWLAYHYHVLPLRHLVLTVDPHSRTDPQAILERWTPHMEIEVWTDAHFLPTWMMERMVNQQMMRTMETVSPQNKTDPSRQDEDDEDNPIIQQENKKEKNHGLWLHLNRQKNFYGACLRHLHERGRSWVTLTDTDEFVRLNPLVYPLPWALRAHAGHVLSVLESASVSGHLQKQQEQQLLQHFLLHGKGVKEARQQFQMDPTLCLLAPRIQVASVDAAVAPTTTNGTNTTTRPRDGPLPPVPRDLSMNASDFLTIRWLYHNGNESPVGKNVVKLYPTSALSLPKSAVHSVHQAFDSCPRNTPGESRLMVGPHHLSSPPLNSSSEDVPDHVDSLLHDPTMTTSWLQIHHYLGTLEQFTFREDPRDVVENRPMQWHSRGQFPKPTILDTGMAAWLHGFVKSEGIRTARYLLRNAGQVTMGITEEQEKEDDLLTDDNHPINDPVDPATEAMYQTPHNEHPRRQQFKTRPPSHTPRQNNRTVPQVHQDVYNATLIQEHLDEMKRLYEAPVDPFSACLVIMDDNHWLIEWLAYHYHVLPLRRLIYVQDPRGRTDSKHIFDRWRGKFDLLLPWQDSQFIPRHILKRYQVGNITNAALHRYRQKFFYPACLVHFKKLQLQERREKERLAASTTSPSSLSSTSPNTYWVLLADTDEFVRPNSFLRQNAKLPSSLFKPGAVSVFLRRQLRADRVVSGTGHTPRLCLNVPRIQMAAKDYSVDPPAESPTTKATETDKQQLEEGLPTPPHHIGLFRLPSGLDRTQFLTLRWLYHNGRELMFGSDRDLNGKNIIDVSQIQNVSADIPKQIKNVHRVLPKYCPPSSLSSSSKKNRGKKGRLHDRDSWLVINHYLGTFSQQTFRQDPRDVDIPGRSKRTDYQRWKTMGQPAHVMDPFILSWLEGFVHSVGHDEAFRLLEHVGSDIR